VQEFRNDTHWPKHVLVHYRWVEVADVDSVAGLYALFVIGAAHGSACSALPRVAALTPVLCAQA
jgi:hypothetical protein